MKTLKVASFGAFALLLLNVVANEAAAQTTWLLAPGTNDVNTGSNWSAGLPSNTVDAKFGASGTTNLSQSAAITIRDMIFDPGAPAYNYGITTGQLTLLNPATVAATQAPSVIENNSTATQVIGGTGAAIGIAGTINAAAGDIVINGAINVGNNSTSALNYVALAGSHNVYFNVDPSINAAGNLTGGAWTSSVIAAQDMYRRVRGRFFLGQTFSGVAYLGDIGNTYQGSIHLNSTANGALRLTNNNSLGNPGNARTIVDGLVIYGGSTNNGTLELAPATGAGISVGRSAMWLDGRSGAVADDPHIRNVSGNNTLTIDLDWNTGVQTPFGTTSEAFSNRTFNAGNWNVQSDAGLLTLAGGTEFGKIYNTQATTIKLQLMGNGNGLINVPIVKEATAANTCLDIVKKGLGTWTLTNPNTSVDAGSVDFQGNVVVQQGTLALSGAGGLANAPTIDVRSGATFDVSGVNGGTYTLNTLNASNLTTKGAGTIKGNVTTGGANNTIAPGDSGIGTLTFSNALTLSGGSALALELSNTPGVGDKVAVTGNLALEGTTEVPLTFLNGNLGNGTYTLLSYGGTLTGGLGNLNITGLPAASPRQTFTPTSNIGAKQINLVVTGNAGNLVWKGGVNGNVWVDGQSEPNSVNWTGHPTDNHFFNGDNVTFNSTGTTFTPVVQGTVNAGAVTFSNGVGANYSLSGGSIVASGPTTFSNAGNVTFTNSDNTFSSVNATGSGNVNINAGNFTVGSALTVATTGTGKVTIANTGGTVSLPANVTLTSGKLSVNRSDADIAIASAISGAGTLDKDGTNVVTLSGNSSAFSGTVNVNAGTLRADGTTSPSYKPLGTAAVNVASGATLNIFKNGTTTAGTGELNVTIAGNGVGGLGALTAADLNSLNNGTNNNAHVRSITLNADAKIGAYGGGDAATRSILWVDGPGAFIQGNGKNLSVVVNNNSGAGFTEMDWLNVGDTNLKNIDISGGGVLYVGGNTTLGPLTGGAAVTLQNKGTLGFYVTGANTSTGAIDKPIVTANTARGGGIEFFGGAGSKVVASPIALDGNLDVTLLASGASSVLAGTFTGAITNAPGFTGTRSLAVHASATGATASGVMELVSDGNTYTGTTTIGGGGGFEDVLLANDKAVLSIGNGGATGSIGPGDITITSPSATAAAALQLNRTGTFSLANNITMSGGAAEVRAVGGGMATISGPIAGDGKVVVNSVGGGLTLTGASTYFGTTTVTSGTLLVNGDNSAVTTDVTVGASGILGGTGKIGGNVLMQADGSTFTTAFAGGTIDRLDIVGNLDLSALANSLTVTGVGTGTSWVIASYGGILTGGFESVTPGYSVNLGTGSNSVITLNFTGLPGDYNHNNKVDAADYVVWRKNPAANGGANGYNIWRQNFGAGSGSSLGAASNASVPEPASALIAVMVSALALCGFGRGSRD